MRRAKFARTRRSRRSTGSRPSRWTRLASAVGYLATMWLLAASALACAASAQALRPYAIVGDAIPDSLTGAPGNAARGRALVVDRSSTCILCHSGPFPEERFQGELAPSLAGAGSRWSEDELRMRLVDPARLNPNTIMPSYYKAEGLERVAPAFRGKTI